MGEILFQKRSSYMQQAMTPLIQTFLRLLDQVPSESNPLRKKKFTTS